MIKDEKRAREGVERKILRTVHRAVHRTAPSLGSNETEKPSKTAASVKMNTCTNVSCLYPMKIGREEGVEDRQKTPQRGLEKGQCFAATHVARCLVCGPRDMSNGKREEKRAWRCITALECTMTRRPQRKLPLN
jgi:hypothetical protein